MCNIVVLDTGGTINKIYNPATGNLDVKSDFFNNFSDYGFDFQNIMSKDSLDITGLDRDLIVDSIRFQKSDKIIVIHGTDTMVKTAKYVFDRIKDKRVIFTGAMVPFSICPKEASFNFGMAVGSACCSDDYEVLISMSGIICPFDKIKKDLKLLKFVRSF